jgi:four helix bundle protein
LETFDWGRTSRFGERLMVDKFEELDCWIVARELTNAVYSVTEGKACGRDFGFVDQMRRAALSVMNNIAEGFERDTNKDFVKFLFIARASAGEVRSMTYVGLDQNYFDQSTFEQLQALSRRCSQLCWGMIRYLRKHLDWKSKVSLALFLLMFPIVHRTV